MDFCDNSSSNNDIHPIKCALNDDATLSTQQSSSSNWSLPSIDIAHAFDDSLVTGVHTDIFSDYEVLPIIIGTGNYGTVRECRSKSTGKVYAVKTIDKSKIGRFEHLQREIELLQMVNHDGIMQLVDCFEDSDYVHLVTEKYSGGELFDKIIDNTTSSGCLPEKEASRIIKSLLESVSYLHKNGIVHRDIKPENILFESNEEGASVKLIDFGLSKMHLRGEAPMSSTVGTAYYMPPEVIKGSYDKACDIWSIGVVTYIILSGYPPFNGANDNDIYNSIVQGNLHFPTEVWDNLSNDAREFVCKLICRDTSIRATPEVALQHPWIVRNQ